MLARREVTLNKILAILRREHSLFYILRSLAHLLLPLIWVNRLRRWQYALSRNFRRQKFFQRDFVRWFFSSQRSWVQKRPFQQKKFCDPLLSVIVPFYNQGDCLDALSRSLASQTFRRFEVILVDDGSCEISAREKLAAIEQEQRSGWLILHQKNCGVIEARNQAIARARGKYIFPLDSDDTIAPTFLEKSLLLLESLPDHYFVYSWSKVVGPDPCIWKTEKSDPVNLLHENCLGVAVFPRQAWVEVGGYNSIMKEGYEDWEFYVNLIRHGYVGRVIPEALYHYRVQEGSRNHQAEDSFIELRQNIHDLHLSYVMRHRRALRRLARHHYRVAEPLVNMITEANSEKLFFWLNLVTEASLSPIFFSRLLFFVEDPQNFLIVSVGKQWQPFFLYNQHPRLHVYFPENYHPEGDSNYFYNYLQSAYKLEKIEPEYFRSEASLVDERRPEKRKLRILYLAPWLITGGADTMTVDWFQQLAPAWSEKYFVTTLARENLWLPKIADHAKEIYDLPLLGCSDQTAMINFLFDFIALRKIDLLHIMNSEVAFKALPRLKESFPELKVVAQFHCFDYLLDGCRTGYAFTVPQLYDDFIDAYNLEYDRLGEEIHELNPLIKKDKLKTIYGRVDGVFYDPRRRPGVPEIMRFRQKSKLNLLFIGRLDRQKQPLRLLAVAALLRAKKIPFVLHVIGEGNLESQKKEFFAEMRRHDLAEYVCLYGEQPLSSLYDWYLIADILLLTSDWEGVPMVLYQAMAMAVVPVVAEVGGVAELVTSECGYLVLERENPEAYVAAIRELLDEKLRQEMASAARQRMLDHFSLAGLDREYKAFYKDIIK